MLIETSVAGDERRPTGARRFAARAAALTPFAVGAVMLSPQSHAQGAVMRPGHVGVVLGMDVGSGGDPVVDVSYTNGTSDRLHAGEGVDFYAGVHYQPLTLPIDFAGMFGYKFDGTKDPNSDLRFTRWTLKATATYELPGGWYLDAGPVWHLSPKLHGGGYFEDIPFNDAVGVTFGAGWRWLGVSYTSIKYSSPVVAGDVDASSVDLTLIIKF
jgi:hypothetical protein